MRRLRVYTVREVQNVMFIHNTALCHYYGIAVKILRFEYGQYSHVSYANRFYPRKNDRYFKRTYSFNNYIDMSIDGYDLSYDEGKITCARY